MNINGTFSRDCTVELKLLPPRTHKKNEATMSEMFHQIYSRKKKIENWKENGEKHTEINLLIKIAVRGVCVCVYVRKFIYLFILALELLIFLLFALEID